MICAKVFQAFHYLGWQETIYIFNSILLTLKPFHYEDTGAQINTYNIAPYKKNPNNRACQVRKNIFFSVTNFK